VEYDSQSGEHPERGNIGSGWCVPLLLLPVCPLSQSVNLLMMLRSAVAFSSLERLAGGAKTGLSVA